MSQNKTYYYYYYFRHLTENRLKKKKQSIDFETRGRNVQKTLPVFLVLGFIE